MNTTIGPQLPQPDPRGVLAFRWLPDWLQALEDSRQDADHRESRNHRSAWTRPATPQERLLLLHLGYPVPETVTTTVEYLTTGVRRRTWDAVTEPRSEDDDE